MIVLGITGSMAMGKSTVSRILHLIHHIPVWDADEVVRELLASDQEIIKEISKRYPQVMVQGKINCFSLRGLAFDNEECLRTLEHIIHEKAFHRATQFLTKMQKLGVSICSLDVPLLFEVGWDRICTHTVVVYAPSFIQKQRLWRRPDLSERKIKHILSRQWALSQKKARATYEIQTGLSKWNTCRQVNRIIKDLKLKQEHYA